MPTENGRTQLATVASFRLFGVSAVYTRRLSLRRARQSQSDDRFAGVTHELYDALNRPISITDALTGTVQYRFDAVGNRTQTIYPDGKIVTATFDAANHLTQTASWDGQVTKYAFDKVGRLITTTLPNDVQSINSYDAAGRLVNLTHQGPYWLLATYTYTLDAIGNRLAVQERVLPPTPPQCPTPSQNALTSHRDLRRIIVQPPFPFN